MSNSQAEQSFLYLDAERERHTHTHTRLHTTRIRNSKPKNILYKNQGELQQKLIRFKKLKIKTKLSQKQVIVRHTRENISNTIM